MAGLRNFEVEKYGKHIIGNNFLGVYPCDVEPKKFIDKKYASVIFNLSKHNEKGSHFIAVFKNKKNVYYFDPLGNSCTNKYINNFLLKCTNNIIHNSKVVQSTSSMFCGIFCLAFLNICQVKQESFPKFLNKFKPDLYKNDKIALHLVLS